MSSRYRHSSAPDLGFLHKAAKRLLKACRAGEPFALDRVRAALPRLANVESHRLVGEILLADVHQAIAREHGHANWGDLKRAGSPLEQLLAAVRGGAYVTIKSRLGDFARLSSHSVHAASALADHDALARHLDRRPELVLALHRGWPPIACVCASPLNRLGGRYSAGLLECARLLLERGADPNTTTTGNEPNGSNGVPLLYRAFMNFNSALSMLLIRHGADQERLARYVRQPVERPDLWSGLMMEYMERPGVRDEMKRAVETWRLAHNLPRLQGHYMPLDLRELHTPVFPPLPGTSIEPWGTIPEDAFDRSPGGFGGQPILHRVIRSAPPALVEFLIERGADVHARDAAGRTAMRLAVRAGNQPAAAVLQALGAAADDVTEIDRLIGAVSSLQAERARAIVRQHPGVVSRLSQEDIDIVLRAAAGNGLAHVQLLLDIGIDPGAAGHGGATALHVAAWHGHVEMVRLLLGRGAPVDATDTVYRKRPIDWAVHGSRHCRTADDEYRQVIAALEKAGANEA